VEGHALLPQHIQQQQQQQQQQLLRAHRIGYVSQSPWLMRGSVRDNVLLGQPYDAELMGEVSGHARVMLLTGKITRGSWFCLLRNQQDTQV